MSPFDLKLRHYEKATKFEKISHLFSLSSVNFVAFSEKLVFNVFSLLRAGTMTCSMNKKSWLEMFLRCMVILSPCDKRFHVLVVFGHATLYLNLFLTCSWHQKNETTNSPIHEFKVLQNGQRGFHNPFLMVYFFIFITLKNISSLACSF